MPQADSNRIAFRELQAADLPFLVSVRNSCRAMLHDDREFTPEQANEWFATVHPRFYLLTRDGAPIGYFRTSNWSEANRNVYVGCDLHISCRGKGLARTAYPLFLRFLFEELEMNKVSLEVLQHNEPAMRLYKRIGFVLEGVKRLEVRRDGRYLDSLIFSMLRSEFMAHYGIGQQQASPLVHG